MGRTSRKRLRSKRHNFNERSAENYKDIIFLRQWILTQSCMPFCDLVPYEFPVTGRGLKTLKDIEANGILIKLPMNFLITTSVISDSYVAALFQSDQIYNAQCVLAVFLIYEAHLNNESRWYPYIKTLPLFFTNPEFCSKAEKRLMPSFILDNFYETYLLMKNDFLSLVRSIRILRNIDKDYCPHCRLPFERIITFQKYQWAYYAVNTRAVYLNVEKKDSTLNIRQPNNIALAPFLDLFNHDINAAVHVSVVTENFQKFYQIVTKKPFNKDSQAFINYGAHNSLKLYIDYGFFIPNNPLDEIFFTLHDIQLCCGIAKSNLEFITFNNFHKGMAFTVDGLNYNARVTLFVVSTKLRREQWDLKIYGAAFDQIDLNNIHTLGLIILNIKRDELLLNLNNMKSIKQPTQSFNIAINLVEEYIKILETSLMRIKDRL